MRLQLDASVLTDVHDGQGKSGERTRACRAAGDAAASTPRCSHSALAAASAATLSSADASSSSVLPSRGDTTLPGAAPRGGSASACTSARVAA